MLLTLNSNLNYLILLVLTHSFYHRNKADTFSHFDAILRKGAMNQERAVYELKNRLHREVNLEYILLACFRKCNWTKHDGGGLMK